MLKLSSFFPIHCDDRTISHVFLSVCEQWQGGDLQARMIVPTCGPTCRGPNLVEATPFLIKKLSRFFPDAPVYMTEKRFLKELKGTDAAYLWPGTSLDFFEKVKKSNKPIFLERVNCHTAKAKHILDDAYTSLGKHPQHPITPEKIQEEEAELELADFIFCPSQEVKASFQEAGIPEQKLILTSEGWSPKRFPTVSADKPQSEVFTVLFLGSDMVRKGAHVLLKAWERADVKGRLILMGRIEPAITEACGEILARPDVVHIGYSKNYASAYLEADIFALPSFEEGSPLVTYEAMAHGLPILASPMGAGGIVRDGIDGMIVSPYNEDAWVEALRKLAHSPELREQFSASSRQRAEEFTWEKVASKRAAYVIEKLRH